MGHTKGLWRIRHYTLQDGSGGEKYCLIYSGKVKVARCQDWTPEQEANAQLIASAPDLLEACEAIQQALSDDTFDDMGEFLELADRVTGKAISKAKGGE